MCDTLIEVAMVMTTPKTNVAWSLAVKSREHKGVYKRSAMKCWLCLGLLHHRHSRKQQIFPSCQSNMFCKRERIRVLFFCSHLQELESTFLTQTKPLWDPSQRHFRTAELLERFRVYFCPLECVKMKTVIVRVWMTVQYTADVSACNMGKAGFLKVSLPQA